MNQQDALFYINFFNSEPLHVSSRLAAHHHQEDQQCINNNWCMSCVVLTECWQQQQTDNITHDYTNCCLYTVDPPDDEQQACSKHLLAYYWNKWIENISTCWFILYGYNTIHCQQNFKSNMSCSFWKWTLSLGLPPSSPVTVPAVGQYAFPNNALLKALFIDHKLTCKCFLFYVGFWRAILLLIVPFYPLSVGLTCYWHMLNVTNAVTVDLFLQLLRFAFDIVLGHATLQLTPH